MVYMLGLFQEESEKKKRSREKDAASQCWDFCSILLGHTNPPYSIIIKIKKIARMPLQ